MPISRLQNGKTTNQTNGLLLAGFTLGQELDLLAQMQVDVEVSSIRRRPVTAIPSTSWDVVGWVTNILGDVSRRNVHVKLISMYRYVRIFHFETIKLADLKVALFFFAEAGICHSHNVQPMLWWLSCSTCRVQRPCIQASWYPANPPEQKNLSGMASSISGLFECSLCQHFHSRTWKYNLYFPQVGAWPRYLVMYCHSDRSRISSVSGVKPLTA